VKISIVAGKFDPIHAGHIDSIIKASKLGDYLVVVTHRDNIVAKTSDKKFCAVPLYYRMILLRGILLDQKIKGDVVIGVDENGTVVNTLKRLRKFYCNGDLVYAKGGDRTIFNMNNDEIELCRELEICIQYGIGDLLNSSSKISLKMGNKIES
jgi:cytidyltransferase-like protein